MQRSQLIGSFLFAMAAGCALLTAAYSQPKTVKPSKLLKPTHQSPSDLEITGLLAGGDATTPRFISSHDLLKLPQVQITLVHDENFTETKDSKVKVSGIYLSVLAEKLGAASSVDLIRARCSDGYLGVISSNYMAAHKPLLVLKMDGLPPSEWARRHHDEDLGPYFVVSEHYNPSFRILSHPERPQVPTNVVHLDFGAQKTVYSSIAPPNRFPVNSPQQQGYGIARITCFKCHASGTYGGTKSDIPWSVLSKDAIKDPAAFEKLVLNPQSLNPKAAMPASPDYDTATLAALTAYFQSLPTE